MVKKNKPEAWLCGPVENTSALLQPVAHALLQAREEVTQIANDFPEAFLWQKPAGVASVGFHLQHLSGVLDRLFTYAKGSSLSEAQLKALSSEGKAVEGGSTVIKLVESFSTQVDKALAELSAIDELILTEQRLVGRAQIPSTVLGLLFHAAEHTMRHVGQLYVTAKVIKDGIRAGL
ncbi:MAG: DinB family protein [Bacteroidota bacterium]|nr:DinB family protein [Bacteroidota bacterium]